MDWVEKGIYALLAALKFSVIMPFMAAQPNAGFLETFLFGLIAGSLGVFIFMYLSALLMRLWEKLKRALHIKPGKPKRNFTRRNRLIVRVKSKYGLAGIALLSPVVISIPIGTYLAVKFFKNRKQVLVYMIGGVAFWSLLFALFPILVRYFKAIW